MNKVNLNFISNLIGPISQILYSFFLVFLIPFYFGLLNYSYWQYYLLIFSFVGIFEFGFNDGFYIINLKKYIKSKFIEVDSLSTFFSLNFIFQLFFFVLILFIQYFFFFDSYYKFIFFLVTFNLIFFNSKSFLVYYFHSINNHLYPNLEILIEKSIFVALTLFFILFSRNDTYIILIFIDLISKIIGLVFLFIVSKINIFFNFSLKTIKIFFSYIKNGFFLMLVNFSSGLFTIILKLLIEYFYGLEIFGKLSLGLSFLNLFIIFFSSFSFFFNFLIVKFETNKPKSSNLVLFIDFFLMILILFSYPTKLILTHFFPEFSYSWTLVYILFPFIFIEGRYQLVLLPKLKFNGKNLFLFLINISLLPIFTFLVFLGNQYLLDFSYFLILFLLIHLARNVFLEIKLKNSFISTLYFIFFILLFILTNFLFVEISFILNTFLCFFYIAILIISKSKSNN